MEVHLDFSNASLHVLEEIYRTSTDTSVNTSSNLLEKLIIENNPPHLQGLKCINIIFKFKNITRALLQELSKHQIGVAFIAKSTRYTLGRIAKESLKYENYLELKDIVSKYYYIPPFMDEEEEYEWVNSRYKELLIIKKYKEKGMKNDDLKKYVNDYMLCDVKGSMSLLALKNMLTQRIAPEAFYQFRQLCHLIWEKIPIEWKPFLKPTRFEKVPFDLEVVINELGSKELSEYTKLFIDFLKDKNIYYLRNLV